VTESGLKIAGVDCAISSYIEYLRKNAKGFTTGAKEQIARPNPVSAAGSGA